jgi:hypothetical protein
MDASLSKSLLRLIPCPPKHVFVWVENSNRSQMACIRAHPWRARDWLRRRSRLGRSTTTRRWQIGYDLTTHHSNADDIPAETYDATAPRDWV